MECDESYALLSICRGGEQVCDVTYFCSNASSLLHF